MSVPSAQTFKQLLTNLEKIKVKTKMKRRVYEEVQDTLQLLDDLEGGRVGLEEAKLRYQRIIEKGE